MSLKAIARNIVAALIFISLLQAISIARESKPETNEQGKVTGQTIDLTGAVVPKVVIVFESSTVKREAVSDEDGDYEIELPAGTYLVTVEKFSMFYPYQHRKLKVRAGRVKKFDVRLKYDIKKYPPVT